MNWSIMKDGKVELEIEGEHSVVYVYLDYETLSNMLQDLNEHKEN